jgi:hypothetical protein
VWLTGRGLPGIHWGPGLPPAPKIIRMIMECSSSASQQRSVWCKRLVHLICGPRTTVPSHVALEDILLTKKRLLPKSDWQTDLLHLLGVQFIGTLNTFLRVMTDTSLPRVCPVGILQSNDSRHQDYFPGAKGAPYPVWLYWYLLGAKATCDPGSVVHTHIHRDSGVTDQEDPCSRSTEAKN